jgi:hypothetical protein
MVDKWVSAGRETTIPQGICLKMADHDAFVAEHLTA